MLRGIRKASANWLGRAVMGVVMGLLAASFAVWGINDIFRGFGRSTLAKIGGTEIAIDQFRRTYNERLQRFGNQVGHPLSAASFFALTFDSSAFSHSNVQFLDVLVQYVHGCGGLGTVMTFSFAAYSVGSSTKGRAKGGDAPDG